MAKCGITNIGGGGGIGSDELTVTKEYVLSGLEYVGADTDDEKGVGIMIDNGTTANQNLNAGGSFLVKGGYHAQDFSVNANSLASQTIATVTSNKVLNGETFYANGIKGTGTIPIQTADANVGNGWAHTTATEIWPDGQFFLGVRNAHYLNGVHYIRGYNGNLIPSNIKKGVWIGNILGTFEGYVPTPTDLYLRGNNIYSFQQYLNGNINTSTTYYRFDAGQITRVITLNGDNVWLGTQANLTGYNYLNMEYYTDYAASNGCQIYVSGSPLSNAIQMGGHPVAGADLTFAAGPKTSSINISAINTVCWIKINIKFPGQVYIYRIWLT